MAFVDELVYLLLSLGFVGVLMLYMTVSAFISYRRSKKVDMYDKISGGIIPLGALGVYLFIMSLVGQLTWPLPGAYNMLFFDPLLSLSIVLLVFAWSAKARLKMHYVGLLSLLAGAMTILYGLTGYSLGMTESPIGLALLFVSFGLAGVFAFPVTLTMDLEPGRTARHRAFWIACLILFWLSLIVATVMAFAIGGASLGPHLTTPP